MIYINALNEQLVDMCVLQETRDIRQVKKMLSKHIEMTDSWLARRILEDFDSYLPHFKKLIHVITPKCWKW